MHYDPCSACRQSKELSGTILRHLIFNLIIFLTPQAIFVIGAALALWWLEEDEEEEEEEEGERLNYKYWTKDKIISIKQWRLQENARRARAPLPWGEKQVKTGKKSIFP